MGCTQREYYSAHQEKRSNQTGKFLFRIQPNVTFILLPTQVVFILCMFIFISGCHENGSRSLYICREDSKFRCEVEIDWYIKNSHCGQGMVLEIGLFFVAK